MSRKYVKKILVAFLLCFSFFCGRGLAVYGHTSSACTIILDAGHGGIDPGKIGTNGALEKDINLSITLKLKQLLEERECSLVQPSGVDQNPCGGIWGHANWDACLLRLRISNIRFTPGGTYQHRKVCLHVL